MLASGPELRGRAGAAPLVLALLAAVGFGAVLVLIAEGAESSVVMTLLTMRLSAVLLLTALLLATAARRGVDLGRAAVGAAAHRRRRASATCWPTGPSRSPPTPRGRWSA